MHFIGGGKITLEDTAYLLGITDSYLSNDIFSAILKEEAEKKNISCKIRIF